MHLDGLEWIEIEHVDACVAIECSPLVSNPLAFISNGRLPHTHCTRSIDRVRAMRWMHRHRTLLTLPLTPHLLQTGPPPPRDPTQPTMGDDGAKVKGIVEATFPGLDETIADYLVSVLSDDPRQAVRAYMHTYIYMRTMPPTHQSSILGVDPTHSIPSHPIPSSTPRSATWRRPWGPSS